MFTKLAHAFVSSPYVPTARTTLITSLFLLMSMSLIMMASVSVPFAVNKGLSPMYFFYSQALYVCVGVVGAFIVYRVPTRYYFNFGLLILAWFVVLGMLALTYLVGTEINGSQRWLHVGSFNLQTAEFAKVLMVVIIADYLVRRSAELRKRILSGWRLGVWYAPPLALIYFQPDYGSVVVIAMTAGVMVFISGVPIKHFSWVMAVFLPLGLLGVLQSDYRRERLLSFWDPFDDVQDSDFQLARSLVAFGRGQIDGVGYGNSVQKLSHLPEAHTDFILAITGEELGLIGVSFVIFLELVIVAMMMKISHTALKNRQLRLSYMAFGFAVVVFGQVMINAGMNMGIAPTKGLTMPFYSYGGSAMLASMIMIGLVLKVDKENSQNNPKNTY